MSNKEIYNGEEIIHLLSWKNILIPTYKTNKLKETIFYVKKNELLSIREIIRIFKLKIRISLH